MTASGLGFDGASRGREKEGLEGGGGGIVFFTVTFDSYLRAWAVTLRRLPCAPLPASSPHLRADPPPPHTYAHVHTHTHTRIRMRARCTCRVRSGDGEEKGEGGSKSLMFLGGSRQCFSEAASRGRPWSPA